MPVLLMHNLVRTVAWWPLSRQVKYTSFRVEEAEPIRISYGAIQDGTNSITHGLADFVAQEEMDRYRGFWWHPDGIGILFARVDESQVPPYRIHHQGNGDMFEDHRYPFCGQKNPTVQLGFVRIDVSSILDEYTMQDAQEVERAMG
ncbi:serine-type peptidase [Fragilaria crotonensis]|nr:serine-type peptidase [Fragilaria crotonensis]